MFLSPGFPFRLSSPVPGPQCKKNRNFIKVCSIKSFQRFLLGDGQRLEVNPKLWMSFVSGKGTGEKKERFNLNLRLSTNSPPTSEDDTDFPTGKGLCQNPRRRRGLIVNKTVQTPVAKLKTVQQISRPKVQEGRHFIP